MDERIGSGILISTSGETSENGLAIGVPDLTSSLPVLGSLKSADHRGGRVGTCKELPAVLRSLGFEPDTILAGAGLDPSLLDDGDNALPAGVVRRMLDACVEQTGCRHVGLLMGARARTSCFGVVGLLMQHLPNVADAVRCLIERGHLYHPDVISSLEVGEGIAMLCFGASPADGKGSIQIIDAALASGCRVMQALCGSGWAPSEVLIAHPAKNDDAAFRRVFQVPVRFDEEVTALVFEARWLAHPVEGADPGFRHILELQVAELERMHGGALSSPAPALATHAAVAKRMLGRTDRPTVRDAPANDEPWTQGLGTSFQHLVDEVRYDIARHLLANANMPLGKIALSWAIPRPVRSRVPSRGGPA